MEKNIKPKNKFNIKNILKYTIILALFVISYFCSYNLYGSYVTNKRIVYLIIFGFSLFMLSTTNIFSLLSIKPPIDFVLLMLFKTCSSTSLKPFSIEIFILSFNKSYFLKFLTFKIKKQLV